MRLQLPFPGYADPELSIEWDITEEAFTCLPEVTVQDSASDQERFRLLLGNWRVNEEGVIVTVAAVMEVPDAPALYVERAGYCEVNLKLCQGLARHVEGPDCVLLGYFHTHPVSIEHSFWPSDADRAAWIGEYEGKVLTPLQPFLFSIGGLLDNGGTGYVAYRVVSIENQWVVHALKDVPLS